MLDPITPIALTGLVISAVSTTSSIISTAIKINELMKEDNKPPIGGLNERLYYSTEITDESMQILTEIDKHFYATTAPCEKALAITVNDIYSHFIYKTPQSISLLIDITLVSADNCGEYKNTLGVVNAELNPKYSTENAALDLEDLVRNLRKLKSKTTHRANETKYSCIVNISVSDKSQGKYSKTSDDCVACMAILGEAISRNFDSTFDGCMHRVGLEVKQGIDYKRKVNLMIEANWDGKRTDTGVVIDKISKFLEGDKLDIDAIISEIKSMATEDGKRNILLLGESGSGKSYTGNLVYQALSGKQNSKPFRESKNGACTYRPEYITCGENKEIRIWDTPGLLDQYNRDNIFVMRIKDMMLELGQINAVILCDKSIERTSEGYHKMVTQYANIIGPAMQERVIVAVNRQPSDVDEDNKFKIWNMLSEAGIKVNRDLILDTRTDINFRDERTAYARTQQEILLVNVLQMCNMKAVRLGILEKIYEGLLNIQNIGEGSNRTQIENDIIRLSSDALRSEIMKDGRREPKVSEVKEHKVVLSRGREYSYIYGRYCYRRWSLKSAKINGFFSRFKANLWALLESISTGDTLDDALKILRQRKLVFLKRDEDIAEPPQNDGMPILTTRYVLLKVDEALDASTIQYIRDIIEARDKRCVSPWHRDKQ